MRLALAGGAALILGFVGVTWLALEASEVAVLETRVPDGSVRRTHVWFVEPDGELWIEAGTPQNPWLTDVGRAPELRFAAEDRAGRYRARVLEGREPAQRVRRLLREKYGWRDAWVGMMVDASRSIAVRLEPLP